MGGSVMPSSALIFMFEQTISFAALHRLPSASESHCSGVGPVGYLG